MRILQSIFGSSYEQQEANDILEGLKLLVHKEASIRKQVAQNIPPKRTTVQISHGVTCLVSHMSKETPSVAPVNIPPVKLGDTVIHRSYGNGTIIDIQAGGYLEINFFGTIREFKHPQAFVAGFLKKTRVE